MQLQKISVTESKLLRVAQQGQLKPGDLVYGVTLYLTQVVAAPGPDGDTAVRDSEGNIRLCHVSKLKMAPLFWLEDKPVYPGDTLYWAGPTYLYGSIQVTNLLDDWVIGRATSGVINVREDHISWSEVRWLEDQLLRIGDTVYQKGIEGELRVHGFEDNGMIVVNHPHQLVGIHINCLTREKPEVETLVEGQPVVEGETLYHKSIAAQGVVVGWGVNSVMLATGQGTISFFTHALTRTDPSILFHVEGKPVRKGDKLYSTVLHSYGDLREIVGVPDSGVYSTPDSPHKGSIAQLTWSAPEIKLPTGEVVHPETPVWHRETGECWEVVSYNEQHGTLFVRQGYSTYTSMKPSSVKLSASLFKLEGKPVFEGDMVWTLSGDEVVVKRLEHGKVITSPSDWNCCTVFTQDWLSLTPIQRIIVDCEAVEYEEVLYFSKSGLPFKVYRQVRDRLEDRSGRSVDPSQLTRNDPTLVEVPIWVNFNDDGTSAVMFNSPGVTRCVYFQAKGTLPLPKHIADKLKR